MDRASALALLHNHLRAANLRSHCLASEAIMRALARRLGQDEERWGLAGLLHDLDFEATREEPGRHTVVASQALRHAGIDDEVIDAIRHHNAEALNLQRSTLFHHALAAAETITGLIVASALVQPDKKLASVKPESVIKRMAKKDFARAVDRNVIRECEKLGLTLEEFVELAVGAMQGVAGELGL